MEFSPLLYIVGRQQELEDQKMPNIVGVSGHSGAGKDVISSRLVDKHGYVQVSFADPIKRFGANVFGFDTIQLWGPAKNNFDPMFNKCEIKSAGVDFSPGCKMSSVTRVCDPAWGTAANRLVKYGPEWIESLEGVEDKEYALEQLYFWFSALGHHYPQLSPRICLQHLGTEWGRQVAGEDVWIDTFLKTVKLIYKGYHYDRELGITNNEFKSPPEGIVVADVRFPNEITKLKENKAKLIKVTRIVADKRAKNLGITKHPSEMEQENFANDLFDCILQNNGTITELNKAVDVMVSAF